MNEHTLSDLNLYSQHIAPQAVATGADVVSGTGVDITGWEGAIFKCHTGAIVDAANTSVAFILQESSDNGVVDTWADVTGITTGAILNAGENEVYLIEVNLSEMERYIRITVDGGSVGGGLVAVECELYRGRRAIPTQQNTVLQARFERA